MKSVPYYGGGGFALGGGGNTNAGGLRGQEVFNWLHRLDLTHHFDKFLSAGVEELGVIRQLGEEQLLALGVSDVHERLTLLQAIRLLHVPRRILSNNGGGPNSSSLLRGGGGGLSSHPGGDSIELSVFKCRDGFFYNNNGYHDSVGEEEGDYSECAEFDLSGEGGCGSGSGGGCSCGSGGDEDPFYESVGAQILGGRPAPTSNHHHLHNSGRRDLIRDDQISSGNLGVGGGGGGPYRALLQQPSSLHPTLLRSLIKEKVIQDRVDLSRIEDESVLRGVAAKYASDLAASLLPPTGGPGGGGGGGTSFSSSSSSSSGYPPSLPPDLHPHVLHALRHLRAHPTSSPYRRPGRRCPSEETHHRPIYTPGVYQPSSCLRDQEEIYDYIPPKGTIPHFLDINDQETHHTPIYSSRSATLGRLSVSTPRLRTPKKGARGGGGQASYGFIRSTPKRTPGQQKTSLSMSSYTISGSCSSSATSPSSTSNNAYGFVSSSFTGDDQVVFPPGNKGEGVGGCRTLIRIGRRLGLSRILRSLRLSGGDGNGVGTAEDFSPQLSQSAPPSTLRRFQSVPPNSLALEGAGPLSSATPTHTPHSHSEAASSSPTEGLPSNERIIETINRLKLKELQRRKERIAHEHRAMSKNRTNDHNGIPDDLSGINKPTISSQEETYEEPIDTKRDHLSSSAGAAPPPPLTPSIKRILPQQGRHRGSAASTNSSSHESFSETFARHLRNRHSASSSSASNNNKTSPQEDFNNKPEVSSESKQNVENVSLEEEEDCPSVSQFLSRHDLQLYSDILEKEGFETLELLMDIEEEDLLRLSIADPDHRSRLLSAAHSLRPSPQRPPCQTSYQWDYYATSARIKKGRGTGGSSSGSGGSGIVAVEVHTAAAASVATGRDSGVFVGKEEELVLSPVTLPHPPPFKAFFPCEKSSDSGVSMSTSSPPPSHRTH